MSEGERDVAIRELEETIRALRLEVERLKGELARARRDQHERPPHGEASPLTQWRSRRFDWDGSSRHNNLFLRVETTQQRCLLAEFGALGDDFCNVGNRKRRDGKELHGRAGRRNDVNGLDFADLLESPLGGTRWHRNAIRQGRLQIPV